MPRQVKGPAVIAFWSDSQTWPGGDMPWDFALRGIYTRHQRSRPMTGNECNEIYGVSAMTGMPWIGKERSFIHGRQTILVHVSSFPFHSYDNQSLAPFERIN